MSTCSRTLGLLALMANKRLIGLGVPGISEGWSMCSTAEMGPVQKNKTNADVEQLIPSHIDHAEENLKASKSCSASLLYIIPG